MAKRAAKRKMNDSAATASAKTACLMETFALFQYFNTRKTKFAKFLLAIIRVLEYNNITKNWS